MSAGDLDMFFVRDDELNVEGVDNRDFDESVLYFEHPGDNELDVIEDDVQVMILMHLNQKNILYRLNWLTRQYGGVSEKNESDFSCDVDKLISLITLYDHEWMKKDPDHIRKDSSGKCHSQKGIQLASKFIEGLKEIPDYCAELFPFHTIDELMQEYLIWLKD